MYSVAAALAFDRAEGRPLMDISTTILIVNSLGAILGPLVVMVLGFFLGDYALHAGIFLACGAVAITCITGKATRPAAESPTPAVKVISTDSLDMAEATAEIVEEKLAEEEPDEPSEARAGNAVNEE
jgi:MFS family permease